MTTAGVWAQSGDPGIEIANLREDVRGLTERVGELTLRVEQLETENASLRQKSRSLGENYVTLTQLNQAVADLNRTIQSDMEKLAEMEKPARPTSAAETAAFSDNFPKEGIKYTVLRGDTIAAIAKKTGAKVADIINANKIADPTHIHVGQALFVPGGK